MQTQTQTKPPLQLGFIGGSLNAAVGYSHFVSSTMDGKWQLVAGCFSKNLESNAKTAEVYGVATDRVYTSLADMLLHEKDKLDAIVVLTPTPNHFDNVSACLSAGVPVICEKSLAVCSDDAQKLIALRDKVKGFLAVTYNYSGYPMLRELALRIRQGKLGKILHFQAEMPQEGFIRLDAQGNKPQPQSWRLSDGDIPTLYLDLAVHLHQIMHYLTDEKPIELVADQNNYGWFSGVVDNASCLVRYSNEIQAQFWFSKSALGHRNGLRIRIYGDRGSAEWYQANPEELLLAHVDGRREILDRSGQVEISNQLRYNRFKAGHPAGFIEAFANLYSDIAVSLRRFQQNGEWQSDEVFSAELALEGMFFLEAMVKSSHSRSWQTIPSGRQHDTDTDHTLLRAI
ncbi:MAG: Gfo/Idh/MocA family oxidoreductase [Pseudomonadota bacterium]